MSPLHVQQVKLKSLHYLSQHAPYTPQAVVPRRGYKCAGFAGITGTREVHAHDELLCFEDTCTAGSLLAAVANSQRTGPLCSFAFQMHQNPIYSAIPCGARPNRLPAPPSFAAIAASLRSSKVRSCGSADKGVPDTNATSTFSSLRWSYAPGSFQHTYSVVSTAAMFGRSVHFFYRTCTSRAELLTHSAEERRPRGCYCS